MKTLNNTTLVACLITFFGISLASAQHYHNHSPSSQTMIQSLRGHNGAHHGHAVTKRSVDTSSSVAPRGCSGHVCGQCLTYQVDSKCSLCTSQIPILQKQHPPRKSSVPSISPKPCLCSSEPRFETQPFCDRRSCFRRRIMQCESDTLPAPG